MPGRQGAENVIRTEGGVMGAAKDTITEKDCFQLFMDQTIIADITERTNVSINRFLDSLNENQMERVRTKGVGARVTTEKEVTAFLGLMYLRAVYKWNYWRIEKYWKSHSVFPATMGIKRFKFLNKYLVFDDPETRVERWQFDWFAAVREIFERWNDNCGCALQMDRLGLFNIPIHGDYNNDPNSIWGKFLCQDI